MKLRLSQQSVNNLPRQRRAPLPHARPLTSSSCFDCEGVVMPGEDYGRRSDGV
jgi:hypothetical protein